MSLNGLATEATATATDTKQPPSRGDALAGLTKYIPVESMTLYIATVSAQKAIGEVIGGVMKLDPTLVAKWSYWLFVFLTPLMMIIFFLRRIVLAGQTVNGIKISDYPWWKIVASTIAFAVWALAVPGNNTNQDAAMGVVAGLAALFVSTILSLLEPFFEKQ